jgi:hypothetical protein
VFKRTCVITALTAAVLVGGTGVASAAQASVPVAASVITLDRPVLDPPEDPYCGPGQRWENGHCRSVMLQVGPGQQESDNLGWFSAIVPVIALGVFLV